MAKLRPDNFSPQRVKYYGGGTYYNRCGVLSTSELPDCAIEVIAADMLGANTEQKNYFKNHRDEFERAVDFVKGKGCDQGAKTVAASLATLQSQGKFPNFGQEDFFDPTLYVNFVINCAFVKAANPDWEPWQIYLQAAWQTASGVVHTAFDLCGLIPAAGEPCDLVNGVIYTLEGNPTDAALSFAATLPIVGWAATGAKWAGFMVLYKGVTHHFDVKLVNGIVDFGDRGKLRTILGITSSNHEAHHIIPWEHVGHDLTQLAGKGNFHMNHPLNGMELEKFRVNTPPGTPPGTHANHPHYNTEVEAKMDLLLENLEDYYGAGSVPATIARQKLTELEANIAAHINLNPTVKINDLTLSGVNIPSVP